MSGSVTASDDIWYADSGNYLPESSLPLRNLNVNGKEENQLLNELS